MGNFCRGHNYEEHICEIIFEFRAVVPEIKIVLTKSSSGHLVQWISPIKTILAEGIMRDVSVISFLNFEQWFGRYCFQIFLI